MTAALLVAALNPLPAAALAVTVQGLMPAGTVIVAVAVGVPVPAPVQVPVVPIVTAVLPVDVAVTEKLLPLLLYGTDAGTPLMFTF